MSEVSVDEIKRIFEKASGLEIELKCAFDRASSAGIKGSPVDCEVVMPLLERAHQWGLIDIGALEAHGLTLRHCPEIKLSHALNAVQHARKQSGAAVNRLKHGTGHLPHLYGKDAPRGRYI